MNRLGTARNVAIVLALAAAVDFLPGGGRAADTFRAVLLIVFAAGWAYLGGRLYREHRIAIYSLGERRRGLLYGALAVGVATAAAQPRMWQTGAGEFVWFVLAGAVVYTLVAVYRVWRAY
jgi:hypothetical protein